jgi:exopolyphosphatase/guanosine-5'-triphosphate,3'-diphosphate pyrophosphatase
MRRLPSYFEHYAAPSGAPGFEEPDAVRDDGADPAEDGRAPRRPSLPARFAAIDVGTNSIRLLVVERRADGRLEPLLRLGDSCRIGAGLEAEGRISQSAEERAARTLTRFVRRARSLAPRTLVAAATHALRSASNGADVAARLGRVAGVPVSILTAEEEARYVYEAARDALGADRLPEPCLVVDIGGGSVELVRGESGAVAAWASLEVGCVRLTERFLRDDPPAPTQVAAMNEYVQNALAGEASLLEQPASGAAVGGTLTALSALDLGLERYEAARVEGHVLTREAIARWSHWLADRPNSERESLNAVGEGRADIIVAGCAVLNALLERTGLAEISVSTHGLRYALARRAAGD